MKVKIQHVRDFVKCNEEAAERHKRRSPQSAVSTFFDLYRALHLSPFPFVVEIHVAIWPSSVLPNHSSSSARLSTPFI